MLISLQIIFKRSPILSGSMPCHCSTHDHATYIMSWTVNQLTLQPSNFSKLRQIAKILPWVCVGNIKEKAKQVIATDLWVLLLFPPPPSPFFFLGGGAFIWVKCLTLYSPGGGGGANLSPPPPPESSAVDRVIAAKICTMVVCDVIYKIVYIFRFSKIIFFYFILINYANLFIKSDILL